MNSVVGKADESHPGKPEKSNLAEESENRYVGNFEDPEHAKKILLDHLKKVVAYVKKNGVESPACVGIIARTFEMVGYRSPIIQNDDNSVPELEYHPSQMFDDGLIGNWCCDDIFSGLGFDEKLSERMQSEAYPNSFRFRNPSTGDSVDGSIGGES